MKFREIVPRTQLIYCTLASWYTKLVTMDISNQSGQLTQHQSDIGKATFDAVFSMLSDKNEKSYPDGWSNSMKSEFQEVVNQAIAERSTNW